MNGLMRDTRNSSGLQAHLKMVSLISPGNSVRMVLAALITEMTVVRYSTCDRQKRSRSAMESGRVR